MAQIPKHVVSHKDLDGFIRHFNKLLKDSVKKVKANETKYKIVKYSKLSIVAKHNLIEKKLKDTDGPMKQLMLGKWSELKSKSAVKVAAQRAAAKTKHNNTLKKRAAPRPRQTYNSTQTKKTGPRQRKRKKAAEPMLEIKYEDHDPYRSN